MIRNLYQYLPGMVVLYGDGDIPGTQGTRPCHRPAFRGMSLQADVFTENGGGAETLYDAAGPSPSYPLLDSRELSWTTQSIHPFCLSQKKTKP